MARAEAKVEKPQELVVLTGELAAIVGKTPQWIRQLTRDGVLQQMDRGKYKLDEAIQAYIEHVQGGKEEDKKPRFIDHKTEHERIKSEKAALELARMRGELHSSSDVEAVMGDMIAACRQKILALPTKMSPQLVGIDDPNVIKKKLTGILHEALAELADYSPGLFEEGAVGVGVNDEA